MENEQEIQGEIDYEGEAYMGDVEVVVPEEQKVGQQEEYVVEEAMEGSQELDERAPSEKPTSYRPSESRKSFTDGLFTGVGIGCIATFVIMWISLFFSSQLPTAVTYESMLSVFIYPLIYLLSVGLVALTAGLVREYYTRKSDV